MAEIRTGTKGEMSTKGLDTIMRANSEACRGVAEHLRTMGVKEDLVSEVEQCAEMCRDIADRLKG